MNRIKVVAGSSFARKLDRNQNIEVPTNEEERSYNSSQDNEG